MAPRLSPELLAAEIAGLFPRGATHAALKKQQGILTLEVVAARSASDEPDDLAAAAYTVLGQVVVTVDGERNGAAAAYLGLATGTRGSLPKRRRALAAAKLDVSLDHFRREREEPLVEAIADELYAADSAHRLRHRHRTTPERAPQDTRLGVDWEDRHRAYRRVWTPVAALRDDIQVLLNQLHHQADYRDVADRIMNMSWRYAQFSRELDRFVEDYGGLWLLANVEDEYAAAEAISHIKEGLPLGEADASWLRLELKAAPLQELDVFIDRLLSKGNRVDELLTAWLDWARGCECSVGGPEANACEVHAWMCSAERFIGLIDRDWTDVADWYRGY